MSQLQLVHMPLSPFGRKVRLVLAEKRLPVELTSRTPWGMGDDLYEYNAAGTLPVFFDDEIVLADSNAITEYLDETRPGIPLYPEGPVARAEVRRLIAWFDQKFYQEVTANVLYEKVHRGLRYGEQPDIRLIRAGLRDLRTHLDYISYLMVERNWLAGRELSVADFAAAAHLSCLDYIGDVPWSDYPGAKEWYTRIKSRPAFRPLLEDRLPGMPPPRHYADLDF